MYNEQIKQILKGTYEVSAHTLDMERIGEILSRVNSAA